MMWFLNSVPFLPLPLLPLRRPHAPALPVASSWPDGSLVLNAHQFPLASHSDVFKAQLTSSQGMQGSAATSDDGRLVLVHHDMTSALSSMRLLRH